MKIIFSILFILLPVFGYTQGAIQSKKTAKQKAHDREIAKDAFVYSDQNHFLVNIYTVEEKAVIGRTHHWFLALTDLKGKQLNNAKIDLEGHLKSNPEVPFTYINPVFSLCDEGKYVIGFVKVNQNGPWVLELKLKNKEIEDTFSYEITIPKVEEGLH